MEASIHFVTTPTADTPGTTLMVRTPKRSYIFGNESEGNQRALVEMGFRLNRLTDYFITGKTEWSNMGGLIGMALTLADQSASSYQTMMETYRNKAGKAAGKKIQEPAPPKLNIYGAPNLKHMLATCRRFIFRKGLPIIATEYKPEAPRKSAEGTILPAWEDENMKVWALSITPSDVTRDAQAEEELASRSDDYDTNHNDFDDYRVPEHESSGERAIRYDRIRTAVLKHMFDSAWSFDTLVERHISEVEMPAVIHVRDERTGRLERYKGPMPGGDEPLPDIKVLTRTPWPGALIKELPPTIPAPDSVSYFFRIHTVRGKFDVKRAKELGLKPGPAYAKLSNGESVTTDEGKTITPEMVLGPDRPGTGIAILDVPTVGHLESLALREEFTCSSVMEGMQAFIWILGTGLSRHPTLVRFMQKLDNVKHIISSSDEIPNSLAFGSAASQTIRLGMIDGERYHVPHHDNVTIPQTSTHGGVPQEGELPSNVLIASRGLQFRIMPRLEMETSNIRPPVDIQAVEEEVSPEIIALAKTARDNIEQDKEALQAWKNLISRPDSEVITLGTGSALPSKYRNVSATLLRVPGIGNYLFDCGENTLGQLKRVFNPSELVDVLRNLRMIWISHLHADHHLGTASVIKAWYQVVHNCVPNPSPVSSSILSASTSTSQPALAIVSHDGMLRWLKEYSSVEDIGYSHLLPLQITPGGPYSPSGSTLNPWPLHRRKEDREKSSLSHTQYPALLGLSDMQACSVNHCHGAMAVSLTFPSTPEDDQAGRKPLKVSYSGDCRPSHRFGVIGKDTTVLIHEATFDDELKGDAVAKKHSTTSEALGVGEHMGAKAVVLTHFSQRYQKIPVVETVGNGDEAEISAGDLVDANAPVAAEDEDQDVDMTDNNVDMTATNVPSADSVATAQEGQEKVIRVRSRDMKVAIAFDYMRVRIGDIAQLEKFHDALNKLLAEDEKADAGADGEEINGNGKKTSPSGEGVKTKKSKRNN